MRRLFGQKPKAPKSAQPSPIPTPIPTDEFRARALNPPPSAVPEDWTIIHDDVSVASYDRALPSLPPGAGHRHSPPSPGSINGPLYTQQPPPAITYNNGTPRSNLPPPSVTSSQKKKPPTTAAVSATAILRSLDPITAHQSPPKSRSPSPESQSLTNESAWNRQRDFDMERQRQQWDYERDRETTREREMQRQKEIEWEREMERERESMEQRQREMEMERQRERENKERGRQREGDDRTRDRPRDKDKERKKGAGLFGTSREKDKERSTGELTRMIGYLTATASEDWSLVLEVCERASATETAAKESAKALRREFRYAEPGAQLSAARLWAIMLRNCTSTFITAASGRKFLDALEDVLASSSTSPVVKERLLDVLAAAAYTHPGTTKEGYRALWRKVKPPGKPDEGIPFDEDEAMLNPAPPPVPRSPSRSRNVQSQVIPIHEDMRRLFEECEIGRGNAQLLNQALTFARPDELSGPVITEWYRKCRSSQDFIMAQIPWATAQADRSRDELLQAYMASQPGVDPQHLQIPTSKEEELLAALLGANEELVEAFRIYDDLERLGFAEQEEREVQERSRKETRLDRSQIQFIAEDGSFQMETPGRSNPGAVGQSSAGPSRSPSPVPPSLPHSTPPLPTPPIHLAHLTAQPQAQYTNASSLAPPRSIPLGPRPARTPSPDANQMLPPALAHSHIPGTVSGHVPGGSLGLDMRNLTLDGTNPATRTRSESNVSDGSAATPVVPSAKAMGKRRAMPGTDEMEEHSEDSSSDDIDRDDINGNGEHGHMKWRKQPVKYVYDAAADRAKDIRRDLGIPSPTVTRFGERATRL